MPWQQGGKWKRTQGNHEKHVVDEIHDRCCQYQRRKHSLGHLVSLSYRYLREEQVWELLVE